MSRRDINLSIMAATVAVVVLIVGAHWLFPWNAPMSPPDVTGDLSAASAKSPSPSGRASREAGDGSAPVKMTRGDEGDVASPRLANVPDVGPRTPWLKPAPDQLMTRIGVGSCLSQRHPQPIWEAVLGLDRLPDVFLMIGDNVYGDIKSADGRELTEAYRQQGEVPALAKVRAKVPFMATWDDHDYGANDAGGDFEHKAFAAQLFHAFWQKEPPRAVDQGIYDAQVFGPEGRRVQVILLDTRSFRSPLKKARADFPYWGRYAPTSDASRTMLGEAQWAWLKAQLQVPADVRIVASSVQVMADGHGFERWGNLPAEEERLFDLIAESGAKGVVIVSGDRHFGALYRRQMADGQVIPEMTASSLNRSYGPSKDGPSPGRLTEMFNQENFGLVEIDWPGRMLSLVLIGMQGQELARETFAFGALAIK